MNIKDFLLNQHYDSDLLKNYWIFKYKNTDYPVLAFYDDLDGREMDDIRYDIIEDELKKDIEKLNN